MRIIRHENNWNWGKSVICITSNGYGTSTVGECHEWELDKKTEKLIEVNEAVITSMSVVPKRRRRGYGNKLLAECEKIAREMGFDKVYLYAEPGSVAYNWYMRHGYHTVSAMMGINPTQAEDGHVSLVKLCKVFEEK